MKKAPRFLWLSIFVVACVLLFYVFYDEAKKNAIQKLHEEQMIHAKQAARGIEEFFWTWTKILTSLAQIDGIINNDSNGKRYIQLIFESHQEQIQSITRVDEKGTILYTFPYTLSIGGNISNQKHFQELLKEYKPVVSDVFKAVQGFDAVALHIPVFKGVYFKGTIAILIDFKNLAKRYLEIIKIGETGYAWVISRDGIHLYHPIKDFIGKSISETYKDFPSVLQMVKEMLQGNQGSAAYTFNRIGNQILAPTQHHAVYMPIHIGNTYWSIAVASSEKDVLSTLSSFRNRLILVIGVIFFGGILFFMELERSKKRLENILNDMSKAKMELEAANERLKELDRLKSAFLATMSHELRTPLNSIIGFTGILLQGLAGALNEEQQKQLSMVQGSARHLLALINDVLDISKIEAGQLALSPKSFELRPSIENMVKMVSPLAQKKGLEMKLHISNGVEKVTTDQRRLEQVILNLLNNAVKFTEKGEVHVSCVTEDDHYLLSVADTGIGMHLEEIEHIFKPFHQIDTGLTRKYEGTGLGLSISKRLIEMMGGTIQVESQWGKGSRFTIRFPKQIREEK